MAKQVIKLKTADLNQAVIRGLSRSAWETKQVKPVQERIHANPKYKPARHKKPLEDLEE